MRPGRQILPPSPVSRSVRSATSQRHSDSSSSDFSSLSEAFLPENVVESIREYLNYLQSLRETPDIELPPSFLSLRSQLGSLDNEESVAEMERNMVDHANTYNVQVKRDRLCVKRIAQWAVSMKDQKKQNEDLQGKIKKLEEENKFLQFKMDNYRLKRNEADDLVESMDESLIKVLKLSREERPKIGCHCDTDQVNVIDMKKVVSRGAQKRRWRELEDDLSYKEVNATDTPAD
ncbi:hypothetical protein IAR55_001296 [Kwoniella newhampshirensis]|uniref:Uncharacterized protein n=1 Tax=Kwoniella newhampshirensis TaxID=1651941 RepID=A0AAW0Z5A9_9TREE